MKKKDTIISIMIITIMIIVIILEYHKMKEKREHFFDWIKDRAEDVVDKVKKKEKKEEKSFSNILDRININDVIRPSLPTPVKPPDIDFIKDKIREEKEEEKKEEEEEERKPIMNIETKPINNKLTAPEPISDENEEIQIREFKCNIL